jgi:excisionase family DNA binding protein
MPNISEHIPYSRQQAVEAITPLAVTPRVAARLLGFSRGYIFRLLKNGQLESFRDGGARRVLMASITNYVARKIAETNSEPTRHGPGRPRKAPTSS